MDNKKKDLIYACPWQDIHKKDLSWSGTHWSLFKALNNYFNMIDIDTELSDFNDKPAFLLRVFRKLLYITNSKALNDPESLFQKAYYNHADNALFKGAKKYKCKTVLQFDGRTYYEELNQYLYIDMAWSAVLDLYYKDRSAFNCSNWKNCSEHDLLNWTVLQNNSFNKCAGVLTMGHWLEKYLKAYLPSEKVHYVGGGINVDYKKINYSLKENNKILFIGRGFERKNGPLVIKAFRILQKMRPKAELYILGSIKKKYDGNHIHYEGNIKHDDLPYYLNICDVFCMPSKAEAYGLVFGEALVFGLPCIGKNCFEMPYFIENGKNGYLLNQDDPTELANLMNSALNNHEMQVYVKKMKDKYITQYSWDTVAHRIYDVIG